MVSVMFAESSLSWLLPVVGIVALILGLVGGYIAAYKLVPNNAKKQAENILKEAEVKGNQIVKSSQIEGRSAALELKAAAEKEAKERKDQVFELEKKLVTREQQIDVREMMLTQKEEQLKETNQQLEQKHNELDKKQKTLQEKIDSIIVELQKVAQNCTCIFGNLAVISAESLLFILVLNYKVNNSGKYCQAE